MPTMEVDKEPATNSSTPPNSGGSGNNSSDNKAKGVSADDNREAFSPELLRLYYARLFPYEQVRARRSAGFACVLESSFSVFEKIASLMCLGVSPRALHLVMNWVTKPPVVPADCSAQRQLLWCCLSMLKATVSSPYCIDCATLHCCNVFSVCT